LDKNAPLPLKAERKLIQKLGPEFILDQGLKRGPYYGMSLKKLKKYPHGMDLGPLKPMLPEAIKHKDQQINLNVDFYQADLARVEEMMASYDESQILLIGRRHVRSNNSWLHNSHRLTKGKSRCTLMLHPDTAKAHNIEDGQEVKVTSRVGEVTINAEVTDELMPGVVSIPHGFGHGRKGVKQKIAQANAGVSVNDLTDDTLIDELSGNAAVNGVPVTLQAVAFAREDNEATVNDKVVA
jgi:anaerobic selenocysteine-containing dehydrogenase